MHIVICEDDEAQALVLKKYFHEYQSTHPSDSISFFSSGEELLQSIDRNPTIHFAFLDIELPGISGLELADILRKRYPYLLIIFITNHPEYISTAFKLHPDQYLLKPIQSQNLFAVMKSLQHEYFHSHIQYVENERRLITIAYSEIIYAEFYQNKLFVHSLSGDYTLEIEPKEMKQTLLDKGLIRTHQGFYVNPVHIKYIELDTVICSDQSQIPISHRARRNLIQQYTEKYATMFFHS